MNPIASLNSSEFNKSLEVLEDQVLLIDGRKRIEVKYHWISEVVLVPWENDWSGGRLWLKLQGEVPDDFEDGPGSLKSNWHWGGIRNLIVPLTAETNEDGRRAAEALEMRVLAAQTAETNRRIAASIGSTEAATMIPAVFLGGCGTPFPVGLECLLTLDDASLTLQAGDYMFAVAYEEITSFEIGGPGETTSSLGVFGGGFGVSGALIGMASAAAINALTSKTRVDTLVAFSTGESEVFLHTSVASPDELRIGLSAPIKRMEAMIATDGPPTNDLSGQLARLASLHSAGALSDEEFAQAKARLLGS